MPGFTWLNRNALPVNVVPAGRPDCAAAGRDSEFTSSAIANSVAIATINVSRRIRRTPPSRWMEPPNDALPLPVRRRSFTRPVAGVLQIARSFVLCVLRVLAERTRQTLRTGSQHRVRSDALLDPLLEGAD